MAIGTNITPSLSQTSAFRRRLAESGGARPPLDDPARFFEPVFSAAQERFVDQPRSDVFVPRTLGESRIDVSFANRDLGPNQLGGPGENVDVGFPAGIPLPTPSLDLFSGFTPTTGGGTTLSGDGGGTLAGFGIGAGGALLKKFGPDIAEGIVDLLRPDEVFDTGIAGAPNDPADFRNQVGDREVAAGITEEDLATDAAALEAQTGLPGAEALFEEEFADPFDFSPAEVNQEDFTVGDIARPFVSAAVGISQGLFGIGAEIGTTAVAGFGAALGGLLSALAPIAAFGVFLFPLMDFLNRGKGERNEVATGFRDSFSKAFAAVGLNSIDIGEVGGQGRTQDPLQELPPELSNLSGALDAVEMWLVGAAGTNGTVARRGSLLRGILQNNLVNQSASPEQTNALLQSILGPDINSAVQGIQSGFNDNFAGAFLGNTPGGRGEFKVNDPAIGKIVDRYSGMLDGLQTLYGQTIDKEPLLQDAKALLDQKAVDFQRSVVTDKLEEKLENAKLNDNEKDSIEDALATSDPLAYQQALRDIIFNRSEND